MKNRFLVFLLLVSSLAYGDRMQNDNIDMQGNAIKNADVQGGTASDTSRITIPKAATATLDALTRKEGTVVFDSTTKKLKVDNGTVLSAVGSGEGGGGLNAVTNPTAATDLTGYSDSDADAAGNDYIRTDTAAELPLSPAVTTGVKIVPDASSEYIAYCGTMPEALQNRKLRFSQWQKPESGYDSGDMKLEIYPSTSSTCASVGTEYALNKDSSGTTSIPSATQDFWVTFDADGSDYFQIRWVRTNASTEYLVVQNVSIGTGDMPTGPPSSGWTSYTPTYAGLGTVTTNFAQYRRVNNTMEIRANFTAGTVTGSTMTVSLPTGHTGVMANSGVLEGNLGFDYTSTVSGVYPVMDSTALTVIKFSHTSSRSITNYLTGAFVGNGTVFSLTASVPIAEWGDSSNVVQYGQQDVEYLYNSSTANSTDTSSYAYGTTGVAFGSFTSALTKQVKALSPIGENDQIFLQVGAGNGAWFDYTAYFPSIAQGASNYGMWWERGSSDTLINVRFWSTSQPTNATYAGAGLSWASGAAGLKWRVKIIRGNALGGFQYATSTASGLVNPYTEGAGVVYAAQFTPTITNGTNVAASTARACQYSRVGPVVTVGCTIAIDPTSTGYTTFAISLPVTSALTSAYQLAGSCARKNSSSAMEAGFATADATNDRAGIEFVAANTANEDIMCSFSYQVL